MGQFRPDAHRQAHSGRGHLLQHERPPARAGRPVCEVRILGLGQAPVGQHGEVEQRRRALAEAVRDQQRRRPGLARRLARSKGQRAVAGEVGQGRGRQLGGGALEARGLRHPEDVVEGALVVGTAILVGDAGAQVGQQCAARFDEPPYSLHLRTRKGLRPRKNQHLELAVGELALGHLLVGEDAALDPHIMEELHRRVEADIQVREPGGGCGHVHAGGGVEHRNAVVGALRGDQQLARTALDGGDLLTRRVEEGVGRQVKGQHRAGVAVTAPHPEAVGALEQGTPGEPAHEGLIAVVGVTAEPAGAQQHPRRREVAPGQRQEVAVVDVVEVHGLGQFPVVGGQVGADLRVRALVAHARCGDRLADHVAAEGVNAGPDAVHVATVGDPRRQVAGLAGLVQCLRPHLVPGRIGRTPGCIEGGQVGDLLLEPAAEVGGARGGEAEVESARDEEVFIAEGEIAGGAVPRGLGGLLQALAHGLAVGGVGQAGVAHQVAGLA